MAKRTYRRIKTRGVMGTVKKSSLHPLTKFVRCKTIINFFSYLIALSTMPLMKYFCRTRNSTTIGSTPIAAAAAAAWGLDDTTAKNPETASVTDVIRGD